MDEAVRATWEIVPDRIPRGTQRQAQRRAAAHKLMLCLADIFQPGQGKNGCFPEISTLARRCDMSRGYVYKLLNLLEKYDYLRIKRGKFGNPIMESSHYLLSWLPREILMAHKDGSPRRKPASPPPTEYYDEWDRREKGVALPEGDDDDI